MNRYEVIYIIDSLVDEAARQELINKFSDLVKSYGGEIEKLDEWGKRRLAYTIDYKNEGYYVLMHIKAEATFPKELERNFEINENIIRYLVVKLVEKRSNVKPRPTPLRPAAPFGQSEPGAQPVVAPTPAPMPEITEPEAMPSTQVIPEAVAPAVEESPVAMSPAEVVEAATEPVVANTAAPVVDEAAEAASAELEKTPDEAE